jgi:UDP-N-acetylmuramate--alanine ligase
MARNLIERDGSYSFTVYAGGLRLGRIKLKVKGIFNVYNALSALAFSYENKIPFVTIKNSLEGYSGVKRRYEYVGEYKDKKCYCDYAHHPSEIASFINCIKDKDKTLFVFQPHTYSRTKFLMDDFVNALSKTENLIIYKTYPAREDYDKMGDGKTLYQKIKKVKCKTL